MIGDVGPYMNDDGDVWVPRTVPYLEARRIVRTGPDIDFWCKLVYVGKSNADLLGFTRSCLCDEVCEAAPRDEYDNFTDEPGPCHVPAWHFRIEER